MYFRLTAATTGASHSMIMCMIDQECQSYRPGSSEPTTNTTAQLLSPNRCGAARGSGAVLLARRELSLLRK